MSYSFETLAEISDACECPSIRLVLTSAPVYWNDSEKATIVSVDQVGADVGTKGEEQVIRYDPVSVDQVGADVGTISRATKTSDAPRCPSIRLVLTSAPKADAF